MADCPIIEGCIFFNDRMSKMPSMAKMYKNRYCRDEFETCARYRVFKEVGRDNVPHDLYPNEATKIADAIEAGRS